MSDSYQAAIDRAREYCDRRNLKIASKLGSGQDGIVFATDDRNAIKAFRYDKQYVNERNVYQRLTTLKLLSLKGFSIPRFVNAHDELLVVETQIVNPPFVVDFAGASLDRPTDFPSEVLLEWEETRKEIFGDDWDTVCSLLAALRGHGIYLNDVKPDNIRVR